MPIIVTDVGIEDARQARLGGFLISLAEFSVSEATGFDVVSDRSQPVGNQVYRGTIESVEAINRDSVRLTCAIPARVPETGQWNIGEVCIWNTLGHLFAHGSITPFPKTSEYGLKFYVFVTMGRLGEVINITTSNTYSLPSAAAVSTLQPPETSAQNAVVVMDQNPHLQQIENGAPSDSSTPSIAVKYGTDGSRWSFIGHSLVFAGKAPEVPNARTIKMDPGDYGFWLSNGEVVICQVVNGPGKGQSRKMSYNASAKTFTSVDNAFTALNIDSEITIWRSHEAALPKRLAGQPDYLVLGIGKNNYSQLMATMPATRLEPYLAIITGNGGDSYTINPSQIPMDRLTDAQHLIVSVDGKVRSPTSYSITGSQLRLTGGLANGKRAALWAFVRSTSEPGGTTQFQETEEVAHGGRDYSLSIVPGTFNNVFVVDETGQQYGPQDFTVNGAKLTFNQDRTPAVGTKLYFVLGAVVNSSNTRGAMTRHTVTVQAATREIVFPRNIPSRENTLLFVNGVYVPRAMYSVASDRVQTVNVIPDNALVDMLVFWSETTTTVITRAGHDTGPQWVDPAGEQGTPNRLIPGRVTYVRKGWASYPVDSVPTAEHLMVFVDDKYLPPSEYTFDGHNIWPLETPPSDKTVEIICFREEQHAGTTARPILTRVTATGGRTVTVHSSANSHSLVVFVGSKYKNSTEYTYNATNGRITFNSDLAAGDEVTAWSYADASAPGMRVDVLSTVHTISSATRYELQGKLDQLSDMILFSNRQLLGYTPLSLEVDNGVSFARFSSVQPGLIGTQMHVVEFSSIFPRRRLALTTDLDSYLEKSRNLADVPDKAAARANLGITEPPAPVDVGQFLAKSLNLADVPDKAAARDNLGITSIIAQMMQNVLLKSNNLADVPDKAAARANLGIVDTQPGSNVESWFNASTGAWRVKLGSVVILGGRYRHGSVIRNEPVLTIPFHTPFAGGCLSVIFSDWMPTAHTKWDSWSQLVGTPSNANFRVQIQEAGSSDQRWQGLDYIAIGFD